MVMQGWHYDTTYQLLIDVLLTIVQFLLCLASIRVCVCVCACVWCMYT